MVEIVFEGNKHRATAYDGDVFVGESTYSSSSTFWIIDHTVVDEAYGGQGIAGKLVFEIVQQARKEGMKIIPLCPFAKREFQKKKEYQDVVF